MYDMDVLQRNIRVRLAILNKRIADVAHMHGCTHKAVVRRMQGKPTQRKIDFWCNTLGVKEEHLINPIAAVIASAPIQSPLLE